MNASTYDHSKIRESSIIMDAPITACGLFSIMHLVIFIGVMAVCLVLEVGVKSEKGGKRGDECS